MNSFDHVAETDEEREFIWSATLSEKKRCKAVLCVFEVCR